VTYDKREVACHKQWTTAQFSLRNFENNPPKSILQVQEFYLWNRQRNEDKKGTLLNICKMYNLPHVLSLLLEMILALDLLPLLY